MNLLRFPAIVAALAAVSAAGEPSRMEPANQMLATAFANMYKLNSMRAKADLRSGKQAATMQMGFAQNSTVMDVTGFDGKRSQGVLVGRESFVSGDGKKWNKATQEVGLTRYRMVIAPIYASARIPEQAKLTIAGSETLDGMPATKLVGVDKIKAEYWIIDHPQFGKLVRKAHTTLSLDRDVDEWVTYYDYNQPVQIPTVP